MECYYAMLCQQYSCFLISTLDKVVDYILKQQKHSKHLANSFYFVYIRNNKVQLCSIRSISIPMKQNRQRMKLQSIKQLTLSLMRMAK
ncbi:CLUMA_CG018505, isoform A [Clunio marinus]|uniref:CLUMA_CG018505, isoform A n=1 Tax=Clunio marinus TaxID=568069 RepID=A0A1J1IZD8_9DIPT|nr:CLUMA_CG018505, isoform A [Clunio marinus]